MPLAEKRKRKKLLASPIDNLQTSFASPTLSKYLRLEAIEPFQDTSFIVLVLFGIFSAFSIMFLNPDTDIVNDIQTYLFIILTGLVLFQFKDVKTKPLVQQVGVAIIGATILILLRFFMIGSLLLRGSTTPDTLFSIIFVGFVVFIIGLFEVARRMRNIKFQMMTYSFAIFILMASLFFQPIAIFTAGGGLEIVVAVGEELLRYMFAVFPILLIGIHGEKERKMIEEMWEFRYLFLANICWVLSHFLRRPINLILEYPQYFIWLFIGGIILGYIMRNYGIGSAMLCHLLINTIIL